MAAMSGHEAFRRLRRIQIIGNGIGAVLAFCYFSFIDYRPVTGDRPLSSNVVYFVVGMAILFVIAEWISRRWLRPLRALDERVPSGPTAGIARRQALAVPYLFVGVAGLGWVLAGLLWGVLLPALEGPLSLGAAARRLFGITVLAGSATAAFIFFSVERVWRRRLPAIFPEGDLGTVPGVPRVPVRTRLLVVFLMISLVPMALLSVVAFNRAS